MCRAYLKEAHGGARGDGVGDRGGRVVHHKGAHKVGGGGDGVRRLPDDAGGVAARRTQALLDSDGALLRLLRQSTIGKHT